MLGAVFFILEEDSLCFFAEGWGDSEELFLRFARRFIQDANGRLLLCLSTVLLVSYAIETQST